MLMINRAAQFAPFAALNGHDETIAETARQTAQRQMLPVGRTKETLCTPCLCNRKSCGKELLTIARFVPDNMKAGGRYVTITGVIKMR
jgi:hypothetical protein